MPLQDNTNDYLSFDGKSIFLSVDSMGSPQLYYRESPEMPKRIATCDDVLKLTHDGLTLIHKALERDKSAALIKAILDLSTEDSLLKSNKSGETVLHLAVKRQRNDVVEVLLNSPLTTPKVFFKSNFVSNQSIIQVAKDKRTSILNSSLYIPTDRYLVLSEDARNILHGLFEKESQLKRNDPLIPSTEIQTLRDGLNTLEEKLPQLREHEHFNAIFALNKFIATVRELDYDADGKETPEFKQGYKGALTTLFKNAPAIKEIHEQRGSKSTLTWFVGLFYDVTAPQNRDRFFTPHTHTAQVLGTISNIFPDTCPTILSN